MTEMADGMNNEIKLIEEIAHYCKRNKSKIDSEHIQDKDINFVVQNSNIPVVTNEMELTALLQEQEDSSSIGSSGDNDNPPSGHHYTNTTSASEELCNPSEEPVFFPVSPIESGYDSTSSSPFVNKEDSIETEVKKAYIRHQDSLAIHKQHTQENEHPAVISQKLVQQKPKALTLKLEDNWKVWILRALYLFLPTRLREGLIFPEPFETKIAVGDGS
ncbi:protein phosphatase 1 regulatory subunit 37 [Caerostris extrusa]|uniref:Protein phosphatase 1 regulatory subunit 37 n=1 Tax=Caerostris extrusa TaxID=172846 RepID=A0AAV4XDV4_CAEEX|nr:protein phosphatase 1 regulatory subunit 37 [Caerostris extrusa]